MRETNVGYELTNKEAEEAQKVLTEDVLNLPMFRDEISSFLEEELGVSEVNPKKIGRNLVYVIEKVPASDIEEEVDIEEFSDGIFDLIILEGMRDALLVIDNSVIGSILKIELDEDKAVEGWMEEQEQMDSWFVPPETEKEIGRSIGHYASENGCFRISFKNALKIDGVFNDIRKNLLF